MIDLEIDMIGKHLKDGDRVLDIGCANGYATFRQAQSHKLTSITGLDFAATMVATAQKTKQQKELGDDISFMEGDVRLLQFPDLSPDVRTISDS